MLADDGLQAPDTSCGPQALQDQMRAEPESFFLSVCLSVSISGASSLHPCYPHSVTESEDDQKQTTSFTKI